MKLKILFFLFFFSCNYFVVADSLTVVKKIEKSISFFTTDNLGNCYLVDETGLYKYDLQGTLLSSFTEKKYGSIQYVDATDPLKVLVFNKDFSSVVLLDAKLSVQNSFNLHDLNIQQPLLICMSRHDGFWVFDKQTNQLKKFNFALQLIFESSDISQLMSTEISPEFLIESEKWLWLNNPAVGVLIFDMFGSYLKTLESKDSNITADFQVNDDKVLFSTGNTFKEINQTTFITKEITYKELEGAIKMRLEQNRIYVLKIKSFEIYSF